MRGLDGLHHGLGHEALAPFAAGGVDPALAGLRSRTGRPGVDEPLQRPGVGRIPDQLPLGRDPAAGHPQLGRRGPVRLEQLRHGRDGRPDPAQHRVPVAGVADREVQHVAQLPGAVVAQQQEPGVDGGGHRGGQRARAGHQFQALGAVVLHGGSGRGRALAHQHDRRAGLLRGDEDAGHVAAGTVQVRLDDVQHEGARRRGVERVAAAFQHRLGGRRRQPVRGRAHPEGALQRGTGGERIRARERRGNSTRPCGVPRKLLGGVSQTGPPPGSGSRTRRTPAARRPAPRRRPVSRWTGYGVHRCLCSTHLRPPWRVLRRGHGRGVVRGTGRRPV